MHVYLYAYVYSYNQPWLNLPWYSASCNTIYKYEVQFHTIQVMDIPYVNEYMELDVQLQCAGCSIVTPIMLNHVLVQICQHYAQGRVQSTVTSQGVHADITLPRCLLPLHLCPNHSRCQHCHQCDYDYHPSDGQRHNKRINWSALRWTYRTSSQAFSNTVCNSLYPCMLPMYAIL